MAVLETVAIGLGSAVARAACGILLGGNALGVEISASAVDVAAQQFPGIRERRRVRRFWEQTAELVADRLQPLVEKEFSGLPDNETAAAIQAVQDTVDNASLT
ncbi:MAG TPA: hypothetical protein VHJ83_09395, partial [Micromonosporaceae bacterium]|nr:hypothetical protein [Micromonosporaceae bacterium]